MNKFRIYHGAKLINYIFFFLKRNGVDNPLPMLPSLKKEVLFSNENITISYAVIKDDMGYYEIREYKDGVPSIIKTDIFTSL